MCRRLIDQMENNQKLFEDRVAFIKQRYLMALRLMRPTKIAVDSLKPLFDEAEMTVSPETDIAIQDDATDKSRSKVKRKKKVSAIPDHLPVTVIEHDLPDNDKTCVNDGTELKPMGFDVKKELRYTPAKFEVIEHRFLKYSCKACEEGVRRRAPLPTLIPQSYASPELLAHIAVSKYCNHLPLYRQEQIYSKEGISLSRQVMADWMIKLGVALQPMIDVIHENILTSDVVSADETFVRLLTRDGVRTSKQSYMWQISRWGPKPLVIFEYDQTRTNTVAKRLLGTYRGYIQVDGYGGYDILFEDGGERKRVGCMAHCLRKFKDLLATFKKDLRQSHKANDIVKLIRDLYEIEDKCKGMTAAERYKARKESDADAIFTKLQQLVALEMEYVSKQAPYYDALRYANNELPNIRRYLENGLIEIDNNRAENAIRPFALGRRNWLFICSEKGAQASANIYSILTTAKANNLNPHQYLTKLIERLPYCETKEDLLSLMPA